MRLLLYEWCCSGGISGPDAPYVIGDDAEIEPLAREGRAMFRALVADALRDGGFEVEALVDEARGMTLPHGVRSIVVPQGREIDVLVAESGRVEATIVVAPETAGVLAARVASVRAAGGRVPAPSDGFLRLASDKQATVDALAAAGIPVPAGRSLVPHEAWPEGFRRPAVRKARSSAGCDGLALVGPRDPLPCPAPMATRLEAWCAGEPVGVSCLLGPRGIVPVAALRQRFVETTSRAYAGGEPLDDPGRRSRAERLAVRAIEALHRRAGADGAGWVGVDMILGARDDGLDDRVLEVNPRVTTSFVGLASASPASLVRAVVDAARGHEIDRRSLPHSCTFTVADEPFAQLP